MRQAVVYQFDDRPALVFDDMPLRSMRRARLYPIGTQSPHRGRMFHYATAPVVPSTSEAETEFVIRARRRKPMTHTVSDELWDAVVDPTNPWVEATDPENEWE